MINSLSNDDNNYEQGKEFILENLEKINNAIKNMLANNIHDKKLEDEDNLQYFVEIILYEKKFVILENKKLDYIVMRFEIFNHFRKIKFIFNNAKSEKI